MNVFINERKQHKNCALHFAWVPDLSIRDSQNFVHENFDNHNRKHFKPPIFFADVGRGHQTEIILLSWSRDVLWYFKIDAQYTRYCKKQHTSLPRKLLHDSNVTTISAQYRVETWKSKSNKFSYWLDSRSTVKAYLPVCLPVRPLITLVKAWLRQPQVCIPSLSKRLRMLR